MSNLDDLLTVLEFQSISTDSQYAHEVRKNAEWLNNKLNSIGLNSEIRETARHPIVLAKNAPVEGAPTVLLYGHYDVQPVDPIELWDTPPFKPTEKNGRIYARGATDNKGQHMAHLKGIEQLMNEEGQLPVNLIVLLEGEEEIGSPNLVPFLEENKEELSCDVILVSDTGMVAPQSGTIGYGLRGIACCEVYLEGPSGDQHSGCIGGAIANPATEIARLVASLHDEKGKITIDGFYDDVQELAQWERDQWATVPDMDESSMLTLTGATALHGEAGYTSAERLWGRPTAEVNGIGSGYQGEGSKTVLPAQAFAKLSFRLVPHQDPEDIMKKVVRHLEQHVSPAVTLRVDIGHSGEPYYCDPNSKFGKIAQETLKEVFEKEPYLIREGGSIPIINDFKRILDADTLMLGLALPDAQIHAPNENFPIENFEAGIKINKLILKKLGMTQR